MKKSSHAMMLLAVLPAFTSFALAQEKTRPEAQDDENKLVQTVRDATQQYLDVSAAIAAGYSPVLGCVSGSDHGAMGIHYVNAKLLNGTLDAKKPQALIYEPLEENGELKLVGVEFIVLASQWGSNPKNTSPPELDGHLLVFVDAPNRYGLPAFYEIHVWAWRHNPQGPFVDWNDHVSCAHQ
ncbi:MAG: hypothetical protein JO033_02200 [Acidobacteriaceae bacterium]|nr:hypothetical protein [Acidobacteriaceae bacterium]MBV9498028.1 hypothetical protein [Acidobacteriaceae bacterium]